VTSVWLNLAPAPEAAAPVVSLHAGTSEGCEALGRVSGSGLPVAALEYLDAETVRRSADSFPVLVLTEVDGSAEEVARLRERSSRRSARMRSRRGRRKPRPRSLRSGAGATASPSLSRSSVAAR
jgi:hypothetical protein